MKEKSLIYFETQFAGIVVLLIIIDLMLKNVNIKFFTESHQCIQKREPLGFG